MNFPNKK